MAASAYFDQVQKLYIAYFGRPADPAGLNYWAANIDAAGGSFDAAIAGFAASSESQALYAAGTTAQLVTSVYIALFNRPPEAAGLAYWVAQIDSATISGARAAYQILTSAGPGDAAAIANKVTAANAFTTNVDTTAEINGYSGANSATVARAFLAKVDATSYSIGNLTADTTKAVIDATGVSPVVIVDPVIRVTLAAGGQTFNGGAHIYEITDGTGNDTYFFTNGGTYNVKGVGGLDTWNVGTGATATVTGLASTDIVSVSAGGTFNVSPGGYTAATTLVNNGTMNFTGAISIDLSLATGSKGFTVTGDSTFNTIMGSSKADTLTGAGGADIFNFNVASRSTLANMDTITDYRAAAGPNAGALDTITISDIVTVASNIDTVQNLSAQATLVGALAVIANAATTNNGLSVIIWRGDTYAYIETTGASIFFEPFDTVIKLSGTPFASGTSIVGLGIDGV